MFLAAAMTYKYPEYNVETTASQTDTVITTISHPGR
jgi:hypothetical protein